MSKDTTKAVGFSFFSPEVVLLFADHNTQHLHMFPPQQGDPPFKLQKNSRKNVVLLLSLDAISSLAPHASDIHRLIVFGRAEELSALGIPLIDTELGDDGTVLACPRQSRDQVIQRIEDEAVDISLVKSTASIARKVKKKKEAKDYDGPTYRAMMQSLRKKIPDGVDFHFGDNVGIPSVMRLMNDISQEDFKAVCKRMISVGQLPSPEVKEFYKWVEGIDGMGELLGKAVDSHLYPDDAIEGMSIEDAAKEFGVDEQDLAFVVKIYKRLQSEGE